MTYPNADVKYSTKADPEWITKATVDLKWEPPLEVDSDDVVGYITGRCPRCGHLISTSIRSTIAGITVPSTADRVPREGAGMICDCGEDHDAPDKKSGCGAAFQLSSAEIKALKNFPAD